MIEQLSLPGITDQTVPRRDPNPCIRLYGPGPADYRCRDCQHFERHRQGTTWFKCALRKNTGGRATDHRALWQTCGRFLLPGVQVSQSETNIYFHVNGGVSILTKKDARSKNHAYRDYHPKAIS